MTVLPGSYVAEHLDPEPDGEQVQPNGVDLRVSDVLTISGVPRISTGGYEYGTRSSCNTENGSFVVPHGPAVIVWQETIQIPNDCVGYMFPRSRFMRSGVQFETALWDAGYNGRGETLINVLTEKATIEDGMPAGQMVFIEADADGVYDGSHQGERL